MKPISTIAAELRTSNPELGHPTARDLNNMLLVKGLICNVVDGKVPTAYGRQKGIQKKVSRDDMGRRFCFELIHQHLILIDNNQCLWFRVRKRIVVITQQSVFC